MAVLKYIMTSKILYKLKKPMCYFGCDIMKLLLNTTVHIPGFQGIIKVIFLA